MKRLSKLQAALYNIIDPAIDFQMHCVAYPMRSGWASLARHGVPRYWITIGKDIVWDFPKVCPQEELDAMCYPDLYSKCSAVISDVLRAYIDCPRERLRTFRASPISVPYPEYNRFSKLKFCDAMGIRWGLLPILQACDRRIGKEKREQIAENIEVPMMHLDNVILEIQREIKRMR